MERQETNRLTRAGASGDSPAFVARTFDAYGVTGGIKILRARADAANAWRTRLPDVEETGPDGKPVYRYSEGETLAGLHDRYRKEGVPAFEDVDFADDLDSDWSALFYH